MTNEGRPVRPEIAARLFRQFIDEAVKERNIEELVDLIRRPPPYQDVRDYLADVIGGLLTKKIKFPNRKPKRDLEEKHLAIAALVLEVKKSKGWKLRSVVEFVAKEQRCSESTVWSAWTRFGPVLVAGDFLCEEYDMHALVAALMTAGREGRKLSDEEMKVLNSLAEESLELQDGLRARAGRSK